MLSFYSEKKRHSLIASKQELLNAVTHYKDFTHFMPFSLYNSMFLERIMHCGFFAMAGYYGGPVL